jgi:hypothetical protein
MHSTLCSYNLHKTTGQKGGQCYFAHLWNSLNGGEVVWASSFNDGQTLWNSLNGGEVVWASSLNDGQTKLLTMMWKKAWQE